MKRSTSTIRYGVYYRKSSESDLRQTESHVRQNEDLMPMIAREGLHIVGKPFEESQSAHKVGRPIFAELVQKTMDGEINGWVCWHVNRLARNPVDGGMVVHLMDLGFLDEIRTNNGVFRKTPSDLFQLQVLFGIAKNDSDEKSLLVRSGLRRRNNRGYPSGYPPVGFVLAHSHTGSEKSHWAVDQERMPLVRKLFRKFLEGNDSLSSIAAYGRKIGLQTVGRRAHGGGYLAFQSIYKMLKNPVYAGFFKGEGGEIYPLDQELPRVVTEGEFEKIGMILGERCVSRPSQNRVYAFTGLIKTPQGEVLGVDPKFHLVCDCNKKFCYLNRTHCPHCESEIRKLRFPRYRSYRYYFSQRAKRGVRTWLRTIEDKKVRGLLADHIRSNLCFPKQMLDWALKFIKELQDDALRDQRREAQERAQKLRGIEGKRRRLNDLRIDGQISSEDYDQRMKEFSELENESEKPDYTLPKDWKAEGEKIGDLAEELLLLLKFGEEKEINDALREMGISMIWDGAGLEFVHSETLSRVLALFKKAEAETGATAPSAPNEPVPYPGVE